IVSEELASILEGLPVCFRMGRGWMVGGGDEFAKRFGVGLMLRPQDGVNDSGLERQAERGRAILTAWALVRTTPQGQQELLELENVPTWQWAERSGLSLKETLTQLNQMARYIHGSEVSDSSLEELSGMTGEGPFAAGIRSLVKDAWFSGRG